MTSFYTAEPPEVRAVIELATMRDGFGRDGGRSVDPTHDLVLETFLPEHAQTIRQIAIDLDWIDRCGWESAVDLLNNYYGCRASWPDPLRAVETLRAELQGDVLASAQLVASALAVAS